MKHNLLILLFLFVAGAALAQPVTRVRLITLQDPPDTTAQYYIQGGGGKDTIKWVPVDTIGTGGGNLGTTDLTLTGSRILDLNGFPLTFDLTGQPLDSFAIRIEAPDGETSGFYVSDGDGDVFLVVNKITGTDFTTLLNYDSQDQVTIGSFGDTLVLDGERLQFSITTIDTDNTVSQVLARDANNELVEVDVSSIATESGENYALAETATADLQNVGTTWEALEAQTGEQTAEWSFSTGTDLYTYSGAAARFRVDFSVCFTMSSAALLDVDISVQENGSDTKARAHVTTSGADADITYCASGHDVLTVSSSDTFGLGAYISSGTHNITFETSQMLISKLVGW